MNKYCNPFGEPIKTNKYLGLSIMLLWIFGWTAVLLLRAIVYMVTASILIV
jgi:hypothetical protein